MSDKTSESDRDLEALPDYSPEEMCVFQANVLQAASTEAREDTMGFQPTCGRYALIGVQTAYEPAEPVRALRAVTQAALASLEIAGVIPVCTSPKWAGCVIGYAENTPNAITWRFLMRGVGAYSGSGYNKVNVYGVIGMLPLSYYKSCLRTYFITPPELEACTILIRSTADTVAITVSRVNLLYQAIETRGLLTLVRADRFIEVPLFFKDGLVQAAPGEPFKSKDPAHMALVVSGTNPSNDSASGSVLSATGVKDVLKLMLPGMSGYIGIACRKRCREDWGVFPFPPTIMVETISRDHTTVKKWWVHIFRDATPQTRISQRPGKSSSGSGRASANSRDRHSMTAECSHSDGSTDADPDAQRLLGWDEYE